MQACARCSAVVLLLGLGSGGGRPTPVAGDRSSAEQLLMRGLRLGQQAAAAAGTAGGNESPWETAQDLFAQGLASFEKSGPGGGQPPVPWDPTTQPGPQLLLESARALVYLRRHRKALLQLERLEAVLPPPTSGSSVSVSFRATVQQGAFRCHSSLSDFRGGAQRVARLLGLLQPDGGEAMSSSSSSSSGGFAVGDAVLASPAWERLSLPPETQLLAAEALSRDHSTHPRLAVRLWELLHHSGVLPWPSVKWRKPWNTETAPGREYWVTFLTSLWRCSHLDGGQSVTEQQHRAACRESAAWHWRGLVAADTIGGGGAEWVSPLQFPLAFDPDLQEYRALPEESMGAFIPTVSSSIDGGWLNSSDVALPACQALLQNRVQIASEWAAYTGRQQQQQLLLQHQQQWVEPAQGDKNESARGMTAHHADRHLVPDATQWQMLYLRHGSGKGGFLSAPCGDGDGDGDDDGEGSGASSTKNGTTSAWLRPPFKATCAILARVPAISWSLEPSYPCGRRATAAADSSSRDGHASRFCMPPGTPFFFDSPGPVAFLRLAAGATVPPHVGTTNLRIKCHLALEVPTVATSGAEQGTESRGATITVGEEQKVWLGAGQVLAFDDSHIHSVANTLPSLATPSAGNSGTGAFPDNR